MLPLGTFVKKYNIIIRCSKITFIRVHKLKIICVLTTSRSTSISKRASTDWRKRCLVKAKNITILISILKNFFTKKSMISSLKAQKYNSYFMTTLIDLCSCQQASTQKAPPNRLTRKACARCRPVPSCTVTSRCASKSCPSKNTRPYSEYTMPLTSITWILLTVAYSSSIRKYNNVWTEQTVWNILSISLNPSPRVRSPYQ